MDNRGKEIIMNSEKSDNAIHDRSSALSYIAEIIAKYDLSLDEIRMVVNGNKDETKGKNRITKFLGYLGGAFIFGGLALFISMIWGSLGSSSRVIITYGPGIVAFIMGIVFTKDSRYEKASTPLFLISAFLLPSGMFVFLNEYGQGNDVQLASMIVFGLLAFQFLGAFSSVKRTSLLFFGFLFWNVALGILMDRANVPGEIIGISLGLSIMLIAWKIDKTKHCSISAFWYFFGSIGLLWSVFDIVNGSPIIDILYLPLTLFIMLLSTHIHSKTLLFVSTCSLLGFLGYFTHEYFADVTGWPIALMIMGFLLVFISSYAVKLGGKIKNKAEKIK